MPSSNHVREPSADVEKYALIHFKVAYWTVWGEHLELKFKGAGSDKASGLALSCYHEDKHLIWEIMLKLPLREMHYYYQVVNDEGTVEKKENIMRKLQFNVNLNLHDKIKVFDTWQDRSSPYTVLMNGAFSRTIGLKKKFVENTLPLAEDLESHVIIRFIVRDWMCEDNSALYITGGIPSLGNWQQDKLFALTETHTPVWEGEVFVPIHAFPFTYKYVVVSSIRSELETGESRLISLPSEVEDLPAIIVHEDGHFRHERLWKGAGIAVPVFSLKTKDSIGVGEFNDLKLLVDLCAKIGFQVAQILPVNDTSVHKTWWDSYPYSSLSVFALHPLYLNIQSLMEDPPRNIVEDIISAKAELEDMTDVDYERTMNIKMNLAKYIFKINGRQILETGGFEKFYNDNEVWLRPYASFCSLRDLFGTSEHWQWGLFSTPSEARINKLTALSPEDSPFVENILFVYYIQYHLHLQLSSVHKYAETKGIALMGDLPIGVDKCSVDTWMYPSLFRMDKSTGAPPDCFDSNGQNWGFPTYNWEEMKKDGYKWWRKRLHKMAEYFHAYRIDHILGFFRIWEIPGDCVHALLGNFRPSYPVALHELESKGIWDIDRLCKPHINGEYLQEIFRDMATEVAVKYLVEIRSDCFELKKDYDTEIKIQGIMARCNSEWLVAETENIKSGLMKLLRNIVLIRNPNCSIEFYPRFDMMSTSSFNQLPAEWQHELRALHDDYFYTRQNKLWKEHAKETLPVMISASDMLICGEDLGMIPSCVPEVMEELGLIGMRIQRMPSEGEFGDPSTYPYLTVCSPSCHDVSTTRMWWEDNQERRLAFYTQVLEENSCENGIPNDCTPEIMEMIVMQHFQSKSILCILPIQDVFALSSKYNQRPAHEEMINDPRNRKHYWRYRIHVNLETLIEDTEFHDLITNMLKLSCRGSSYWRQKRSWTKSNINCNNH